MILVLIPIVEKDHEVERIYEEVHNIIEKLKKEGNLILLDYWSTPVVEEKENWNVCKYELRNKSERGDRHIFTSSAIPGTRYTCNRYVTLHWSLKYWRSKNRY